METFGFILFVAALCVPPVMALGYCGKWMKREDTRGKRSRIFAVHLLVVIVYSLWLLNSGSEEHNVDVFIPDMGGFVFFLIWLLISEVHAAIFLGMILWDIEKDKRVLQK